MQIKAELVRLIFENTAKTFAVAKFKKEDRSFFVASGKIPVPAPGRIYKLSGDWVLNEKFGFQFKIKSAFPESLTSAKGISAFLSSGRIKGVGKKTAEKIINAFGEKTAEIIEKHPEKLKKVKGLKKNAAEAIIREWKEDSSRREVLIYLLKFGVGPKTADKISRELGPENVVGIVEENPYVLSEIVGGIGFRKADSIALGMGIPKNSRFRIRSALGHVLSEAASSGHTCLPREDIVCESSKITGTEIAEVEKVLEDMVGSALLRPAVFSGTEYIYNFPLERAEKSVCTEIMRIFGSEKKPQERLERADTRDSDLKAASENIHISPVSVVTGGPGTGKTTLIKKVISTFKGRVELCAPTGRAAKRLEEVTGTKAKTIHRMLNYNPATGSFRNNSMNRIDDALIIADESSMIDVYLASSLLQAVGRNSRIVFVGDANQLPPVGPGNFFKDITECGLIPSVRLGEVFRQKEDSGIIPGAESILKGMTPKFNGDDFIFVNRQSLEETASETVRIAAVELKKKYGSKTLASVQVITPVNGGVSGTRELNSRIAELLNPGKNKRPAAGDKVMQISNDYDLEIFNGDTGVVIWAGEYSTVVDFSYKTVEIEGEKRDNLVLGYAVTVHKSQGSEYPAVVAAIHSSHYIMLARDLLYTAVTRGKEMVILVGDKKALHMALANDRSMKRYFFLRERLKIEFDKIEFEKLKGR